jgi:hypothetical protein
VQLLLQERLRAGHGRGQETFSRTCTAAFDPQQQQAVTGRSAVRSATDTLTMVFVHSLQYCSSACGSVGTNGGLWVFRGPLLLEAVLLGLEWLEAGMELQDVDLEDILALSGPCRVSAAMALACCTIHDPCKLGRMPPWAYAAVLALLWGWVTEPARRSVLN